MALGSQSQHAWLVIASFLAGVLNAMAGGGSFLSFPALLSVGVLPIQANATNTVALWPGQFTSIAAYWQDLKANLRLVFPVCSAALLGGVLGAIVLLHTGQATFLALVPWLLLLAAGLFAVSGPVSAWLRREGATVSGTHPHLAPLWIGVVVVCFYIGYFGAGAGFLLIATNIICAAIGAGIGALVGAVTPLLVAGILIGFGVGVAVVINRFKNV